MIVSDVSEAAQNEPLSQGYEPPLVLFTQTPLRTEGLAAFHRAVEIEWAYYLRVGDGQLLSELERRAAT